MIRTNLATRPFYNERAVHAGLALVALIVVALTALNAWRIVTLSRDNRELNAKIAANEARATELRATAAQVRQGLDPQELKAVSTSAIEANTIIDRRLFSWTELFNRLEATLPEDARITSIRPQIDDDGHVELLLVTMAKQVEDVETFVENLEATGAFSDVLATQEMTNQDGIVQATVQGRYLAGKPPAELAPRP